MLGDFFIPVLIGNVDGSVRADAYAQVMKEI
jgi:hypothetical protein